MVTIIDTKLGGLDNPENTNLPKTIRLIFHDCISGCNGCVNFGVYDPNLDNEGLQNIFATANWVYNQVNTLLFYKKYYISRADVIALMACRAVYISSTCSSASQPEIDFKFGRKTCSKLQDNQEIFASADKSYAEVKEKLSKTYGWIPQEMVCAMGAHTLGRNGNKTLDTLEHGYLQTTFALITNFTLTC